MSDLEDKTPAGASEPAASKMTADDAEEINSDVRRPGDPVENGQDAEQPSEKDDVGSGNREAPHQTKQKANDPDGKKGRAESN